MAKPLPLNFDLFLLILMSPTMPNIIANKGRPIIRLKIKLSAKTDNTVELDNDKYTGKRK